MTNFGSRGKWGWLSYIDKNGDFVIEYDSPREGRECYHGKFLGINTPCLSGIKEEDIKQYNEIVKYFNELVGDSNIKSKLGGYNNGNHV